MSTRCLNKVTLIGNLTRDPELRYTPSGTAVCNFGLATNRRWTTSEDEQKESAQFHRVVAWSQLAELCAQLLHKGNKVYVEGRIQYREWTGQDEVKRQTTEIVINNMILLDSHVSENSGSNQLEDEFERSQEEGDSEEDGEVAEEVTQEETKKEEVQEKAGQDEGKKDEEDKNDDIPF